MFRWLTFLFAAFAVSAFGAIGDLRSFTIGSQGWDAYEEWLGYTTNGTHSSGLGTNNSLGTAATRILSVMSAGFDDTGTSNWTLRLLVGTTNVQFAYPGDAFADRQRNNAADATANGAIVTNRIALSDYIYPGDSVTISVRSGAYSNNNAAIITAVNGSQTPSPKPIGCWLSTPFNLMTGNSYELWSVAFHRDGMLGRPVRVVRHVFRDQHNLGVTNFATAMFTWRLPFSGITISFYKSVMDISGLTQGDEVRGDFTAYPWYGTNTLDTMDGVNARGPYYAPITNVCNRLGTYGRAYAIVDSTASGNAGVVSSNAATTWQTPFRDQVVAMNAIALSNAIWHGASRSNHANSFIYVASSNYSFYGNGVNTARGNLRPPVWMTLAPYPTNLQWAVALTNGGTGIDKHCQRQKIEGFNLASVSASAGLYGEWDALWITNCLFDLRPPINGGLLTNGYITGCIVSNAASGSFAISADNTWQLGLDILDITTNGFPFYPQNLVGYARTNSMTADALKAFYTTDQAIARVTGLDGFVCAYNDFRGYRGAVVMVQAYGSTTGGTNGGVLVDNLCEAFSGNINHFSIGGGTSVGITNMIVWNNAFLGNRCLTAYDDTGTTPHWRVLWSMKNNLWDWKAIKSDTFVTASGARTGNWAVVYGAGCVGELSPGMTNRYSTPAPHQERFAGIGSINAQLLQTNWFQFVNIQSQQAASMSGMGNYHLLPVSPARGNGFASDWVLSSDIAGNPFRAIDPPGPYAYGIRTYPTSGGLVRLEAGGATIISP